jgi:hypothetical protein
VRRAVALGARGLPAVDDGAGARAAHGAGGRLAPAPLLPGRGHHHLVLPAAARPARPALALRGAPGRGQLRAHQRAHHGGEGHQPLRHVAQAVEVGRALLQPRDHVAQGLELQLDLVANHLTKGFVHGHVWRTPARACV